MRRISNPGAFKPTPSRLEARSDTTTRVAREITSKDAAVAAAKTERLRAARLAREASAPPEVAKTSKKKTRK